jgi:hypothetical protein
MTSSAGTTGNGLSVSSRASATEIAAGLVAVAVGGNTVSVGGGKVLVGAGTVSVGGGEVLVGGGTVSVGGGAVAVSVALARVAVALGEGDGSGVGTNGATNKPMGIASAPSVLAKISRRPACEGLKTAQATPLTVSVTTRGERLESRSV